MAIVEQYLRLLNNIQRRFARDTDGIERQRHDCFRLATLADVPAIAEFERLVWGKSGFNSIQITQCIQNVPRGNLLTVSSDGRISGYVSFCTIDYEEYKARNACTWNELSGYGTASTHVEGAPDLFGISLGVAPWASRGTSDRLLLGVVREGLRAGARRGFLGARMPKYYKYADRMSPQEYYQAERRPNIPLDPELRLYQKFGFEPTRLVENYFKDPESLNWGVLMEIKVPKSLRILGSFLSWMPLDSIAMLKKKIVLSGTVDGQFTHRAG